MGGEDPLEKGMTAHSSIFAWRIHPMERGVWRVTVRGVAESDVTEQAKQALVLPVVKGYETWQRLNK